MKFFLNLWKIKSHFAIIFVIEEIDKDAKGLGEMEELKLLSIRTQRLNVLTFSVLNVHTLKANVSLLTNDNLKFFLDYITSPIRSEESFGFCDQDYYFWTTNYIFVILLQTIV